MDGCYCVGCVEWQPTLSLSRGGRRPRLLCASVGGGHTDSGSLAYPPSEKGRLYGEVSRGAVYFQMYGCTGIKCGTLLQAVNDDNNKKDEINVSHVSAFAA